MNQPNTLRNVPLTCLACKAEVSVDCERRAHRDVSFVEDGKIVYVYQCPECDKRPWLIIPSDSSILRYG